MAKEHSQKKNRLGRVGNITGWHVEIAPGQPPKRISHNPRLIDTHPEIAAQWHPSLNGKHTPQTITSLSTYRAWWKCELGHEWQRQVHRRAWHASGCPECELQSQSLASHFPKLAQEGSKKNAPLAPNKVRCHSSELVWWTCAKKEHDDYQRTVANRTDKDKPLGCPFCEGTAPQKTESFGGLFPELVKEWPQELNEGLNPFHFWPNSSQLIWWRCVKDKEHEWQAPIAYRTKNSECPYCRMWYVTDENRLSSCFPEIASEWHPKKNRFLWSNIQGSFKSITNLRIPLHQKKRNRRLRPSDVAINCDEVCWWKCAKGHEWEDSVEGRAMRGRGCPDCAREKLITEKSLAAQYPAVAKLWHPTRNLPLQPTDIVPGSTVKVYWRCPKSATHVWKTPVHSVVRSWKDGSNGCRWCSGLSADEKNSLASKYPAVAKLWHKSKNGTLLPSDVTAKSNKRVWWQCGKPKHEFEAQIYNMVGAFERGSNGCKFCSGRAVAPDNCLKRTFPSVAAMWHPKKNGDLTPSDVTQGASNIVFWICEYGHEWQTKISYMVQSHRLSSAAKGCPYCYGKKASAENNLWDSYPEVAKLWDSTRNEMRPWEITPRSHKRFFWQCAKKHSWTARVGNVVTAVTSGRIACPQCR